jgi:hypothetical protein
VCISNYIRHGCNLTMGRGNWHKVDVFFSVTAGTHKLKDHFKMTLVKL